jgi:hypothetical protein
VSKFREGMEVVCVSVYNGYNTKPVIGRKYIVVEIRMDGIGFRLKCKTTGDINYFLKEDFVLIDKRKMIEEILK